MIIHASELAEIPQHPRPLALKRVINIDEHTPQISVTWARLWGHHDRVVNEISDRVYYIIEGEARFQVGDASPLETVVAGDFVFIPRNVPYEFEGTMRYIVMNGPAFRAASDKTLPSAFEA